MKVTSCRVCSATSLAPVLDLGETPAANYFLSREELSCEQTKYPLRLCGCQACGFVMLDEVVAPEAQFRDYHYLTSASAPLVEHFAGLARDCEARGWVTPGTRVLDIGANDGTLLNELRRLGASLLGIDPARPAVRRAAERGLTVLPYFFSDAVAARLTSQMEAFDLITCTNVFAHVDDVAGFLAGVTRLLGRDGVVVMEVAHLLDMIVKRQFDVIYHEHVSYFSLRTLMRVFAQSGLEIFDACKVATQGGSLRIYARRKAAASSASAARSGSLCAIREEEEAFRIHELATLQRFADDVRAFRHDLRVLVSDIRKRRQKIVGLGAPAKGVTLLNFCGMGPEDVAYLVDSTELKQGRFLPGVHIPVYAEEALRRDERPCDYFLLLSWNFQDRMLEKITPYRANGAKVILPFPRLRVI
jgi:SAM-dependent methyltransferase